jgi:trehalose/maltose hydrolase-like predicted phosphorylase
VLPVLCGTLEQHISADIAYAVWCYWLTSGDTAFLQEQGAEIICETARFWESRAVRESDGLRHIRGVIGPDEYHENVDDNAYTNVMARWNLACGVSVAELLRRRWPPAWQKLCARIGLDEQEVGRWREAAQTIFAGRQRDDGVIEQFAGFFDLEPIDLADYAHSAAPIDVVLGHERTQHTQVLKQADTVMALVLLWEQYSPAERAANFAYYSARCGHGSSLSPGIHALVAARLGQTETALQHFRTAAAIDLDENDGSAALGVHLAALGSLWQTVTFGFAGLTITDDGLSFAPQLPREWRALRFPLTWRGRRLRVEIDQGQRSCRVTLERGRPCSVTIGGQTLRLRAGEPAQASLEAEDGGR